MDTWNTEKTTAARDESLLRNHVLAQWGTWPLGRIDHMAVQSWVSTLGTTLAPATVAECHRLTSAVMRSAVANRLIGSNPCEGVRLPKRRKHDSADQVIRRTDFRNYLLPAVPDRHRAVVGVAGGTGLRWGEVVGLCEDAIDLDAAELRVIRTVIEVGGHTSFKPYPKSSAGRRTVPMPLWLVRLVREHLDTHPRGPGGLLFTNAAGGALRRTLFRSRVWKPALVRAGLLGDLVEEQGKFVGTWSDATVHTETFTKQADAIAYVARHQGGGLRFHDLRHSYATWLVDDGVPVNMVQRVMGHERASTTLQLYTRRTDDPTRILRVLDDDDEEGSAGAVLTPR
jgi:integrase